MNDVGVVNDGVDKVSQPSKRDLVVVAIELRKCVVIFEDSGKRASSLYAQFLMLDV
jgi:hypothetical protein